MSVSRFGLTMLSLPCAVIGDLVEDIVDHVLSGHHMHDGPLYMRCD